MSGSIASPNRPAPVPGLSASGAGPGGERSRVATGGHAEARATARTIPSAAPAPGPAVPVDRWHQRVSAGGHDWYVEHCRRARLPAADGRGDGPDAAPRKPLCLLLHGTGASAASWETLAPLLAGRYDVVAPDLPAHARTRTSPSAALDIDAQAAALQALIVALEREPDVLIGHSAGAVIAAAWALHRARGVVAGTAPGTAPHAGGPRLVALNGALLPLEGPAGWVFQPLARLSSGLDWLPRLFARRAEREPGHVRRMLRATGSRIDEAMVARYRPLLADGAHVAGVLRMMAAWDLHGFAHRLAGLPVPLHLFAGDGDRTIPLRHAHRLRSMLPGATLDVLPGLGHLAHEEAPERVATAVLNRLDTSHD